MSLRVVPEHVRPAAVAGLFYPSSPIELRAVVDDLLAAARRAAGPPLPTVPLAVVVPHAGYVYSGPVAAVAYAALASVADRIERVVVVGPAHRVPVTGLALSSADAFATPLGLVAVDRDLRAEVAAHEAVRVDDRAHAAEHSLEVQLPFLQRSVGDVKMVALVAGRASATTVAEVLRPVWGRPGTVVVVSTDLSHYLPDDAARRADAATARAVVAADPDAISTSGACGAVPLRGVLTLARATGARVRQLALATSADTAGDPERVVGYGAFVVEPGGGGCA